MKHFLDQTSLLVVTCVHENLDPFANRIVAFLSGGDPESEWEVRSGPLDLSRVYSGSPPRGGGSPLRAVMWAPPTLTDWTAWYVNSRDGRSHLFAKLSQAGGGPETVSIRSTIGTDYESEYDEGGVQEFTYRAANSNKYEPTRSLQWLEGEDGYRLVSEGQRMPFEDAREQSASPICNRQSLLKVVRDLGIDLESDDFWRSNREAVYLSQHWLR